MKQIFTFIILWLSISSGSMAQPPNRQLQQQQNIEALKVAFLTRQLQLTPDEAKMFWPVHDKYEAEIRKTIEEHRREKGDEIALEEKLLAIRKKYKPDFVKAIGEEKFNKMLRVEREFKDMLRRELERRKGTMPQGGGGMRQRLQ